MAPEVSTVRQSRTSIAEVARMANVSKGTVSNVFSGRRQTSDPVRRRVISAAEKLNYRPHYAAQMLAQRRTMNVGAAVVDIANNYATLHLQAIEKAASNRGYRFIPAIVTQDPIKIQSYLDNFSNGQVDGVLILSSLISDAMILDLIERGFPVGTPLRMIPGHEDLCGLQIDIAPVYHRLLDYLFTLGHREFGFICGYPSDVPQRYATIHEFARDKALRFGPERVVAGPESLEQAEAGAYELLKRCPEITCIVCTNDVLGVGTMAAAYELGLRVPEDISITGFDDVSLSRYCIPRLTTVKMPISEIAQISLDNLVDRIEGKKIAPMVKLKPELIIRGSTAPPRSDANPAK